MISLEQALSIHRILIDRFGGSHGLKDKGALESALNRPFATFDQSELYPTPQEKAAAILESILVNHPFVDGNKRIGYVLMRLTLMTENLDIEASETDKYSFVIKVASGKADIVEIIEWIKAHTK